MYLGQKDEKVHQFVLIKIKASIIIIRDRSIFHYYSNPFNCKYVEGGNLAASKIRNLECPNYEICLIDYGCGKFNRKIHIMEQYP